MCLTRLVTLAILGIVLMPGSPTLTATIAPSREGLLLIAKDADGNPTNITGLANANEVQTIEVTGTPVGDTATFTLGDQTTAPIAILTKPPARFITFTFPSVVGHVYSLAGVWNFDPGRGSEAAPQAFDQNPATKWLTFANTGYLQYEFGGGQSFVVTQYAMTAGADTSSAFGRAPKDWSLLGSNDGTTWTTLDTQINKPDVVSGHTSTFSFANTTAYKFYRLNITKNNGDLTIQLAELALIASGINVATGGTPSDSGVDNGNIPASEYEFITYQSGAIVSDLVTSGMQSSDHGDSFTDGTLDNTGTLVKWLTVTASNVTASVTTMQLRWTATRDGNFWVGGIRVRDITASTSTYYDCVADSPNIILSTTDNDPTAAWQLASWTSPNGLEYIMPSGRGFGNIYSIDPGSSTAALVLQNALEALSNVGSGNISVVDNSFVESIEYTITWVNDQANLSQPVLICSDPAFTVDEVTAGGSTIPILVKNGGDPIRLVNGLIDEGAPHPYWYLPTFQSSPAVQTAIFRSLQYQGGSNSFEPLIAENLTLSKFFAVGQISSEVGIFTFTRLKPGTYQFSITYITTDHVSLDSTIYRPYTAIPILIKDGAGNVLHTYTIDQTQVPSDYSDRGVGWKILGSFTTTAPISALSLVVTATGLPDRSGGIQRCATIDAVQLTRTSSDESIVLTDDDNLVLTIQDGWMTTAAGAVPGSTITPIRVAPILPPPPTTATMIAGMNLEGAGPTVNYFTHSNLAYAANPWGQNGSIGNITNDDAYPTIFFSGVSPSLPVRQTLSLVTPANDLVFGDPSGGTFTINDGLFIVTWVGDPSCGLITGAWCTCVLRDDIPRPSNLPGDVNWAVYEIRHQPQVAGVSVGFFAETSTPDPDDETGTRWLINLTALKVYPPDPSDPTGNKVWGLNTGTNVWTEPPLFHPWFDYKLEGLQSHRYMGIINTNYNSCGRLSDFKVVSHANRSVQASAFQTVDVASVQAVSGDPYFVLFPAESIFQVTTKTPHGLFDGCLINFRDCGTAEFPHNSRDLAAGSFIMHVVDDLNIICYDLIFGEQDAGTNMTNVLTPVAGKMVNATRGTYWPIEDMVARTVASGCKHMWFNLPITMDFSTGGEVYQTITKLLSLLPAGIKVHVECGNECWNNGFVTYEWCRLQTSILLGVATGDAQTWYAVACKAMHDECVSAFTDSGRRSDLIRVVGGQATQPGVTVPILTKLQELGAEFEELCVAPYINNWPAAGYHQDQCPIYNGMTTEQWCDYFELMSVYGGYPETGIANQRPVLDSFGYNNVHIVAYESGVGRYLPTDPAGSAAPGNDPNFAYWQNAIRRHPRMYGAGIQFDQSYQNIGLTHLEWFDLGGQTTYDAWGLNESGNQQRGTGNPSLDTINVSNPQAKNQVLAEMSGSWRYWASLVGSGGSTVATTVGVLASPAPTVNAFSIVGTVLLGEYPSCLGRILTWAPTAANYGYIGKIYAQQVNGSVIRLFSNPPMSQAPATNDVPVVN